MERTEREEANMLRLKGARRRSSGGAPESLVRTELPPGRTLPRLRRILVRFGRPITFERDDSVPNGERHRRIADQLHGAVAARAKQDRAGTEGPV